MTEDSGLQLYKLPRVSLLHGAPISYNTSHYTSPNPYLKLHNNQAGNMTDRSAVTGRFNFYPFPQLHFNSFTTHTMTDQG